MSDLKTQYREFLKSNPKCKYSYDEWMDKYWEPSKKIEDIDIMSDEILDWDVTLSDGLENE
jgi:hypothetical protein